MKTSERSPIRSWRYAVVAAGALAALFSLSTAAPGYAAEEQSVAVEGMLEATYDLEITWADGRKMAARRSFMLRECYAEPKKRSF